MIYIGDPLGSPFLMASNSYDETELSSVNSILGAIGQAPVSRIYEDTRTKPGPVLTISLNKLLSTKDNKDKVFNSQPLKSNGTSSRGLLVSVTFDSSNAVSDFRITNPGEGYIVGGKYKFISDDLVDYEVEIQTVKVYELEFVNPEIAFIYNILQECSTDIQNEGWSFNTERHYDLPLNEDNELVIPANILRLDISDNAVMRDTDVVRRKGKLYNKLNHSYKFDSNLTCDIIWCFDFADLPSAFQRYIVCKASTRAATQLVASENLTKLLSQNEAIARANIMEYECNQGDYNFMGFPDGYSYRSYQPYTALRR